MTIWYKVKVMFEKDPELVTYLIPENPEKKLAEWLESKEEKRSYKILQKFDSGIDKVLL